MTKKKEEKENKWVSYGWVYPKCGGVYAIWVDRCSVCGPKYVEISSGTIPWSSDIHLQEGPFLNYMVIS